MSCELLTRCQCDAPGTGECGAGKTVRWELAVPGSARQLPSDSWVVTFKRRKCDLLIKLEFQNVAGTRTLLGVGSTPACSMRNLPRSRALVRDVNVDGKGNQSAFLLSGLTYGY